MNLRVLGWIFFAGWQVSALAVQDPPITREELAMMPPYCTALLGKHIGLPQPQNSPLRDTIPANCPALHHYCFGLQAMIRTDRNRGVAQKYWLNSAIGHFKERSTGWETEGPTCSVRPEAYTNLGKAQLRQNKALVGQAVVNFNKALELRPDYAPAYLALIDTYVELGKKTDALETATQGLRYLPDSKNLLRRFKELGGKTPPPPVVAEKPAETGGQSPSAVQSGEAGAGSASPAPASTANAGARSADSATTPQAPVAPVGSKIGTPTNPYCRFCPPE